MTWVDGRRANRDVDSERVQRYIFPFTDFGMIFVACVVAAKPHPCVLLRTRLMLAAYSADTCNKEDDLLLYAVQPSAENTSSSYSTV